MNELIEFLAKFHKNAPPFISENENSYSLVGSSDRATGMLFDYGELGKAKLTAKNHSKTLLSLMNFIILVDAMSDNDDISFEDDEVIAYLEFEFLNVLNCYFEKEVVYSKNTALKFARDNPQIVNEALYNITKDKEQIKQIDYQSIVDGLEGSQFEDPYINIAYEVAKEFNLRPFDVITEWSTSELIVTFAKLANDNSLKAFLDYKYSQPNAPKRKAPIKQAFYFEEIGDDENE